MNTVNNSTGYSDASYFNTHTGSINNFGNIRAESYPYDGVISPINGWECFDTPAHGYQAIMIKLRYYYQEYQRDTLAKIFATYAPSSDGNNPDAYARFVSSQCGCDINADAKQYLYSELIIGIVIAVAKQEGTYDEQFNDDATEAYNNIS